MLLKTREKVVARGRRNFLVKALLTHGRENVRSGGEAVGHWLKAAFLLTSPVFFSLQRVGGKQLRYLLVTNGGREKVNTQSSAKKKITWEIPK